MTKQEYESKFHANQKLSGRGLETTMHMPCPFCAEPDFLVYRILETETKLQEGAVCKACGRGIRTEFKRDTLGGTYFEMVQTCGDPAPDYMPPMRRVDEVRQ